MYKIIQDALKVYNGYAPTEKEIHIIECDRTGDWIVFSIDKFVYTWDGRKIDKYYEEVRLHYLGDTPKKDRSYVISYNDKFRGYI